LDKLYPFSLSDYFVFFAQSFKSLLFWGTLPSSCSLFLKCIKRLKHTIHIFTHAVAALRVDITTFKMMFTTPNRLGLLLET